MDKLKIIFLLIAGTFFLYSCNEENGSNPITPANTGKQTIVVECKYATSYRDSTGQVVNIPNVEITGKVYAEKYPSFVTCKVNGVTKTRKQNLTGYTIFGDIDNYKLTPVFNDLENINLEISTDFGTVKGTVSIPDIAGPVQVSEQDTLPLNTQFDFSWQSGKSSWHRVLFKYFYPYNPGNIIIFGKTKDSIMTENSMIVPGSFFNKNGEISTIMISSFNGALPGKHKPNLTGDGQGFAIYRTLDRYYEGNNIAVGTGMGKK